MPDWKNKFVPLGQLSELSSGQHDRLRELWILSVEELVSLCVLSQGKELLARALGMDLGGVSRLLDGAKALMPERANALMALPPMQMALGLVIPPERLTFGAPRAEQLSALTAPLALPSSVDHVERMFPIRDQGMRGTCVAHAGVAVREFLTGRQVELSEQFLYWACKELDGLPGAGTYIHTSMSVLEQYGVCERAAWPYCATPVDGNEGQGPPPAGATEHARPYRTDRSIPIQERVVQDYKSCLAGGKVLSFGVAVFESSFGSATARQYGKITMPLPDEETAGGHAMCVVGYQDDSSVPGGGYFIVRNSWGTSWAYESPHGAGYCMIPYAYVSVYASEAFSADASPLHAAARPVAPREDALSRPAAAASSFTKPGPVAASVDALGNCGVCGARLLTRLEIKGTCSAPGCDAPVCQKCWLVERKRVCAAHT